MGYTSFTKELVGKVIEQYNPKSIVDLGAQNDFSGPVLPAPYISEWYRSMGIKYSCIDLNGENNANKIDLAYPFFLAGEKDGEATFVKPDIVGDIGTSEHVGRNGAFSWNGIYD
jgi:hypothetical protein